MELEKQETSIQTIENKRNENRKQEINNKLENIQYKIIMKSEMKMVRQNIYNTKNKKENYKIKM